MAEKNVLAVIEMDFGDLLLEGELDDTPLARKFLNSLPLEIKLTRWGDEVYGPIGSDLGTLSPVSNVPDGSLAYSQQGGFFCIFFGETPAWPVDIIGRVRGGDWNLLKGLSFSSVAVRQTVG